MAQPNTEGETGPVLVIADLHLDVWKRTGRDPLAALPDAFWAGLGGVIIAGDLSNEAERKWPRHLARFTDRMAPDRVHVLPGNHDYYGLPLGADDRLQDICDRMGVRFVQKTDVRLGQRRFLCATLWTDFKLPGADQARHQADFRRIGAPDGPGSLTPNHLAMRHRDHLSWLSARLADPFAGDTIVVTHHAPLPNLVGPGQPAAAFASDLSGLIQPAQISQWLYGHTHHRVRADLRGTLLRNMSFGTPDEVAPDQEAALIRANLIF